MKFTCSTKPLIDALSLGIVNQNVSKFYQKSCLAQITATRRSLTINLEAANILTEIHLKGSGDVDETKTIFVDSLVLKQLVSTFDAQVTTFEYTEGGLLVHSGSSKFTLPKLLDDAELELKSPCAHSPEGSATINIDKSDWKFIKDHQMYAIAMSFIHPVYTKVWVGENGDVLVGDFDNSLFTHSLHSKLGTTCLLSDTIINLFNSLPEGAKLTKLGKSYLITVNTDGFEYASEFTPRYEEDPEEGSYNSDIILDMMKTSENNSVSFNVEAVNKFLNQATLLSTGTEDTIAFKIHDNQLELKAANVDCKLTTKGEVSAEYVVEFRTSLLRSVVGNFDEDTIYASPMIQDDETVGFVFWTKNMTVVLAGIDE